MNEGKYWSFFKQKNDINIYILKVYFIILVDNSLERGLFENENFCQNGLEFSGILIFYIKLIFYII